MASLNHSAGGAQLGRKSGMVAAGGAVTRFAAENILRKATCAGVDVRPY